MNTTTAKSPAAPAIPDELTVLLKRMRMPYVRAAAPDVLATAKAQRWDPAEVLRVLLVEEVKGRDDATRRMRRRSAGFPTGKTCSSWREADSSIPAPTQTGLATLERVHRADSRMLPLNPRPPRPTTPNVRQAKGKWRQPENVYATCRHRNRWRLCQRRPEWFPQRRARDTQVQSRSGLDA